MSLSGIRTEYSTVKTFISVVLVVDTTTLALFKRTLQGITNVVTSLVQVRPRSTSDQEGADVSPELAVP